MSRQIILLMEWLLPFLLFPTNLAFQVHDSTNLPNETQDVPLATPSKSPINTQASWEFNHGLEGWGQATSNELQADLRHMSDELHMAIQGPGPHLDSPWFGIEIQETYVLAIRYRFLGKSQFEKIHLRDLSRRIIVSDREEKPSSLKDRTLVLVESTDLELLRLCILMEDLVAM